MKPDEKVIKEKSEVVTSAYSKKQIISSEKFGKLEKDILLTFLQDERKYTLDEVKEIIDKFKRTEVKLS